MKAAIYPIALVLCLCTAVPTTAQEVDSTAAIIRATEKAEPGVVKKFFDWSRDPQRVIEDAAAWAPKNHAIAQLQAGDPRLELIWEWARTGFQSGELRQRDGRTEIVYPVSAEPDFEDLETLLEGMLEVYVDQVFFPPLLDELEAKSDRLFEETERLRLEMNERFGDARLHTAENQRIHEELFALSLEQAQAEGRLQVVRDRLQEEESRLREMAAREFERERAEFEAEYGRLLTELEGAERLEAKDFVTSAEVEDLRRRLEAVRVTHQPNEQEMVTRRLHEDPVYTRLREMLVDLEIETAGLEAKREVLEVRERELEPLIRTSEELRMTRALLDAESASIAKRISDIRRFNSSEQAGLELVVVSKTLP